MNYFRARAAVIALDQFSELVGLYWRALPPDNRASFELLGERPESDDSFALRQRIHWVLPTVAGYADELGVNRTFWSGSHALGFQPLDGLAVITQDERRTHVSRPHIVDLLTRCRAAAQAEQRRAFWRMVIPVYWLVDVPALLIRWPFLVLRAARLPSEWENTAAGRLIKVLELLLLIVIAARFGLQLDTVAKLMGR
jgi:hypothetical protein